MAKRKLTRDRARRQDAERAAKRVLGPAAATSRRSKGPKSSTSSTSSRPRPTPPASREPTEHELLYGVALELRATVEAAGHPIVQQLYAWFEQFNAEYFGGDLPPATILLASTRSPRALGDHARMDEHGIRYRVRIAPACLSRGERFVADVLLHELVHVACSHFDEDDEDGYRGHGPLFARRCNQIGAQLGLPKVAARPRGRKKEKNPELKDCAAWPVNVRSEGYYPPAPEKKRKPAADVAGDEQGEQDESSSGGGRGGWRDTAQELSERVGELEAAIRDALEQLEDVEDFHAGNAAGVLRAVVGSSD